MPSEMTDAELNRIIAERVMGWTHREDVWYDEPPRLRGEYVTGYFAGETFKRYDESYKPTESIADAIEAVEALCKTGGHRYELIRSYDPSPSYTMRIFDKNGFAIFGPIHTSSATAICLALAAATETKP